MKKIYKKLLRPVLKKSFILLVNLKDFLFNIDKNNYKKSDKLVFEEHNLFNTHYKLKQDLIFEEFYLKLKYKEK